MRRRRPENLFQPYPYTSMNRYPRCFAFARDTHGKVSDFFQWRALKEASGDALGLQMAVLVDTLDLPVSNIVHANFAIAGIAPFRFVAA